MALPGLAGDRRFTGHALRKANEDELDALSRTWTATNDKWVLADQLQKRGIVAMPAEHLKDMLENDPQLHRHYQQVSQPVRPDIRIPMDRETARWVGHDLVLGRAPMLGEHNQYVEHDVHGRSDENSAAMVIDEVFS